MYFTTVIFLILSQVSYSLNAYSKKFPDLIETGKSTFM